MSTVLTVALLALVAWRPPMPRHSSPLNVQFVLGWLINECPYLGMWLLASVAIPTLVRPEPSNVWWWLIAGIASADAVILAHLAIRASSARPALSAAMEDAFGTGAAPTYTRPAWWRIVLIPVISWRPDVRRVRNRRYGPARRGNRLDIYLSRRKQRPGAPVFVYVHPGGFRIGNKLLGGRPLIYRLAAEGWVCVSIDYRLFRVGYADQLADVRAATSWIRDHVSAYGGDPRRIFLAGGSSGAHLAATAALSGTEVSGVIGLYGYYGHAGLGSTAEAEPTSPHDCLTPAAPPFLIAHGTLDTLSLRNDARSFADQLRSISLRPVAYAELPGAQHNFDFFHSVRAHAVTDAVQRFSQLVETMEADSRQATRG